MYRQYIHKGSNPQDPNWLTSGESIPLLLFWVPYLHSGSRMLSRSSKTTHRCRANLLPSHCLRNGSSLSPLWTRGTSVSLTSWTESAESDSPYQSLNTALLASQPYPLKGPYKSASPGPNEEYSVPISSLRAVVPKDPYSAA